MLKELKDIVTRNKDTSPEAQLGIERDDGECGFTLEEMQNAPIVFAEEPEEDD